MPLLGIHPSVAYASFAVFGAAGVLYLFACINEWYKSTYRAEEKLVRYSKKLMSANFFISLFIIIANVALILEQGFYERESNVFIWWPRSIAYALSFSTLTYVISQVLMVRKREGEAASKAAFLFIVCSMVLGSFTASDDFHWIYFGLSFVPLLFLYSILVFRSRRSDRDSVYTTIMVSMSLLLIGYAITWGLSPDGSGSAPFGDSVISYGNAFWIYFALDIAFYVVLPFFCLIEYIPYSYARSKLHSAHTHAPEMHYAPKDPNYLAVSSTSTTTVHQHHHSYSGVHKHQHHLQYEPTY